MVQDICRSLDWDTQFFGFRIAQMNARRLDQAILERADNWCRSQQIRCLYFIADTNDEATVKLAERSGFHLADVRLTLARQVEPTIGAPPGIRKWSQADISALTAIARVSHRDSRFYFDNGFPDTRCDDLYETWIEKSCAGYADTVLVADVVEAAGYITCHLGQDGEGRLGLVAVAANFQGKRLGSDLVHAALNWFAIKGVSRANVTTQIRNVAAQRLYQRCGFLTASTQLVYHRWFEPQSAIDSGVHNG